MIYGETNLKGTQKMGKIYFKADMENTTLNVIKEAHDCAEVANDLIRIQRTIAIGTDEDALHLDLELRRKYPVIDICCKLQILCRYSRLNARLRQQVNLQARQTCGRITTVFFAISP